MVSRGKIGDAIREMKKFDSIFTQCLNAATQVFSKQTQDHLVAQLRQGLSQSSFSDADVASPNQARASDATLAIPED